MQIDVDLALKIGLPAISIVATKIVNDYLERRPKLVCFIQHASEVPISVDQGGTSQPVRVRTHAIVVANQGRVPAKNVRIGHLNLPDFDVFPDIQYEKISLPGGSQELLLPILGPKEQITINYLYFRPLTYDQVNTHVKSDEGPAKILNVLPTPQLPRWLIYSVWSMAVFGVCAALYLFIRLVI